MMLLAVGRIDYSRHECEERADNRTAKKHNRREQQETYIQENVLNRQFPVV